MSERVALGTLIRQAKPVRCGNGEYPVLSMTMHEGLVFQDDKFKKVIASKDRSDYKVVFRNQLVISFPIDEGVLAAQRITDAGIVSPAYGIWDIDQDRIDPEFLECALRCNRALQYYKANLRGSTARRRSLPTPTLLAYPVPLFDLAKQKSVLETIRKANRLLNLRKQQLSALDTLIKARFVEMFGDLADPSSVWPLCKLVSVCVSSDDIKCGPFGTQLGKDEYQTEGIPIWEIPQISSSFTIKPKHFLTSDKAYKLRQYALEPGDIVMSRKGNVGKCALFPDTEQPGILHSDVLRIRVDSQRVNPCFMMHQLHYNEDVIRQILLVSSGAIMAGVNVTKLKEILVRIPPFELQCQFAAFVLQVDKSKFTSPEGRNPFRFALQYICGSISCGGTI